jgi:hypothetical protein
MGYSSVMKVTALDNYKEALSKWDRTKPIRGRAVDIRPLGQRSDVDSYSIRKNPQNDAIECVLYKTPVVAFMPDGEVHIRNGGYTSISTHMFIECVLRGVRANAKLGKTVVSVGGQVTMLGGDDVLRLNRCERGRLQQVNPQTNYAYRIDRKGANNVRARFKEFYGYFKGFIKLRSEEREYSNYETPRNFIKCTFAEIGEALGTTDGWGSTPHSVACVDDWKGLTMKPGTSWHWQKVGQSTYEDTMQSFLSLITADQPGETKHLNFHKAVMVLLTYQHTISKRPLNVDQSFRFDVKTAKTTLDTALFKWFAPEVLERYEVPMGKVPDTKYDSWMKGVNT